MSLKLHLIAAACENMGIGNKGDLPWRLKTEMAHFTRMTTTTNDKTKKNVVLMGRRTWECIPPKYKPLANRFNFILSRNDLDVSKYVDSYSFKDMDEVVKHLEDENFKNKFENVWVIGGSHIYKATMDSKHFYRLYLTEIKKSYDCDTFMPPLGDNLHEIHEPAVPKGVQREGDVEFVYKVYQNKHFKE